MKDNRHFKRENICQKEEIKERRPYGLNYKEEADIQNWPTTSGFKTHKPEQAMPQIFKDIIYDP